MRPIRVAFVSHHPHLRMGGQRSMVLLIEYLDRAVIEPMVICPAPGELSEHLASLGCPVVYIPLYHIKPRTALAVWRSSRRIRALLRERAIDIIAPDTPRDARRRSSMKSLVALGPWASRTMCACCHSNPISSGGSRRPTCS